MSLGIDYGLGRTNIDTTTGIRYGCISQLRAHHPTLHVFVLEHRDTQSSSR